METTTELARRLRDGLDNLERRGPHTIDPDMAQALADAAAELERHLANMPEETRRLMHTADSGFAATGAWVNEAIDKQDDAVSHVARGAMVMNNWLGPDGLEAEKVFFTRGNIRAWAHRWRTEDKGTAQVDTDPGFMEFASECLNLAGVEGDYPALIDKALRKDWRTA